MTTKITDELAKGLGIITNHEIMDNGEKRFRLNSSDGSSYIKTVASSIGSWQNSHFHKNLREIYVVQSGWIGFADIINDKLRIRILFEDDFCLSEPNVPHNIFMSSDSIVHTIKYGTSADTDWNAFPQLDDMTKNLDSSYLLDKNNDIILGDIS